MHGRFLYLAGLYLTTPVLSGLEPIIGCIILERRNSSTTVLLGSAVGMAIFFILAPPAKAQPQVLSADFEHALAKGDRLRPLVKGSACSARSWPNYDQSCQFDLHVGRSGPPGAGARFGEGWQPAQRRHRLTLSSHGPGAPSSLAGPILLR